MKETLEELTKRIVASVEKGEVDGRVVSYVDYKTKYMVLKPQVAIDVELTSGKVVKIDVTDYFDFE